MSIQTLRGTYATDAGMLALWHLKAFAGISSYEAWEKELLDDADILRHIAKGSFVPINIGADGAFACELRVSESHEPPGLSERERSYCMVTSQPYFFTVATTLPNLFSGVSIALSGIEHVERNPGSAVGRLKIARGEYEVRVNMIAWDREPGTRDPDGRPSANALPDFVILVNRAHKGQMGYRIAVETFDRES